MRNWQRDAPIEIAKAVSGLPDDATLKERKAALRKHAWHFHCGTSWGKKVWSKHCRQYLARFDGSQCHRATIAHQFADDIIFPFREQSA